MVLEESNNDNQYDFYSTLSEEDELVFKNKLQTLEAEWHEEAKNEQALLPWYRKPNRVVFYLVVTFYTLSFTILLNPLMVLMVKNACVDIDSSRGMTASKGMSMYMLLKRMNMGNGDSASVCKDKSVYKTVSGIQTILSVISGFLGFSLSSKLGQLSDRFGRVCVFKLFSMINVLHSFGLIVYFQWFNHYNKYLMIFFLSVGYFSGGIMTLISNANGYVCDIEDIKNRTISISVLMGIIYLSLGIGPLLSAFVIKKFGEIVVLWVSLIFAIISAIIVYALLVESKNKKSLEMANHRYHIKYENSKTKFFSRITNYFKPIKRLWLPRSKNGSIVSRVNVLTLVFVDMVQMAACVGTMHILILYCISKFNWTGVEIGYYTSITGFGKCFVLFVIQPLLQKLLINVFHLEVNVLSLDIIDRILIVSSMFFIFVSLLVLIITDNPTMIYFSAILQSLAGMVSPIVQGTLVKYSSQIESGEMFGVIAVTRHLQMVIIPVLFLQIYSSSLDKSPKIVFWIPMIGSIVCCLLGFFGLKTDSGTVNLNSDEEFEMSS